MPPPNKPKLMVPPDQYPANQIALHLAQMRKSAPEVADNMHLDIRETFNTPQGARVLELLINSILFAMPPSGCDDRALREIHGQRLLVGELRRLAAHG